MRLQFLFNVLLLYLVNFVLPDRVEKQRKGYCSASVEMRLICKGQGGLAKGSERPAQR